MILQSLIFMVFILFFFLIPAQAVMFVLKVDEKDPIARLGICLILGMIIFTISIFIFRLFGLDFIYVCIVPLVSSIYFFKSLKVWPPEKSFTSIKQILRNKVSLLIITLGVITQNIVLFRGGWRVYGGYYFPSLHDTMWNIALANELFHHFPPQHPGLSGYALKNNHYFYPLMLAGIKFLTHINIMDLYFRLGPILVSLAFGLSLYLISIIFTQNTLFRALTIFLGYFAGNISYILPLFLGRNFNWQGNTFFADQPFDQIINPYTVLGFAMMLMAVYTLFKALAKESKIDTGWGIICGLAIGIIYGFKSFGGIIVILALTILSIIYILKYKKMDILIIPFFSGMFFVPIFLFTTDPLRATLSFYPGWILTQMISDADKLNLPQLLKKEDFYYATNNAYGFLKIRILELFIYIFGNLGTRALGLFYSLKLIISDSGIKQKWLVYLFIFLCIMTGLTIPLIFNLKFSTFNIIQFTPYSLVLLAVITAVFLERIYIFLARNQKRTVGLLFISLIVILSIPVNIKNALSKIPRSTDHLDSAEVEALNYLRDNTPVDSIVLINPMQFKIDAIYISALSERRVYLASPGYAEQVGIDPSERLKKISVFFTQKDKEFLKDNHISYIYFLKENSSSSFLGFSPLFVNNRVVILDVTKI